MFTKYLDPKNDVAFRKIFGSEKHKDILIHFLNDILDLSGKSAVKEVTFLSPIQNPEIAYKKQSIVDVLCKDDKGVQFIVEMQIARSKGFEKRAQYYAAKAYSRQSNEGDKYYQLKEVVFIAIANCILFKDKNDYISRHVVLDKNNYEHDLKDFSFTFIELPKFKKKKTDKLDNIIEKWCQFFKYAPETLPEDVEGIIKGDVISKAYDALNQFNWSEEELIAYEQEVKRIKDNEAVEEQKLDEAKVKSREEGRQEEKIAIARLMLIKNL